MDSVITVAEKVISRRTVGDHYCPASAEEYSKQSIPISEDMAEEQLSRGKKTPCQPSEDSAAETWMVKVNHDEVKSKIVSDVF